MEFWHFFTNREADAIQAAVTDFEAKYPGIKVNVHGGQDDEKMLKAIAAGQPIDLALSSTTDRRRQVLPERRLQGPEAVHHAGQDRPGAVPAGGRWTTPSSTGVRCTLPMLSDDYGLYYNKAMIAAAGITDPPKTISELTADAKKLTVLNPDGSIKVAGFVPVMGWYEDAPAHFAPSFGSKWLNADATSAIGGDPTWVEMAPVAEEPRRLVRLRQDHEVRRPVWARSSRPTTPSRRARSRWRSTASTAAPSSRPRRRRCSTAPRRSRPATTTPTSTAAATSPAPSSASARAPQNPEAAWLLMKYLTTDTDRDGQAGQRIRNIPTTKAGAGVARPAGRRQLQDVPDDLRRPAQLDHPVEPDRRRSTRMTMADFFTKWQEGKVSDINAALEGVDKTDQRRAAAGHRPLSMTTARRPRRGPCRCRRRVVRSDAGTGSRCWRSWRRG